MSQFEYQRLIDGGVEVLQKRSVRELITSVDDEGLLSSDVVRIAVMNHPRTQQFIKFDMPRCQNEQEASEMFCSWLCDMQSFETWARVARKYRGQDCPDEDNGEMPEWYVTYLDTDHWTRKKTEVLEMQKCCVLCSNKAGKLDTHHRTYVTLGKERLWDLSLLCDSCHVNVHKFLKMCIPQECPEAVRAIIDRESRFSK